MQLKKNCKVQEATKKSPETFVRDTGTKRKSNSQVVLELCCLLGCFAILLELFLNQIVFDFFLLGSGV